MSHLKPGAIVTFATVVTLCLVWQWSLPASTLAAPSDPLPIESVVAEMSIDSRAGVNPSPDGTWLAYDMSDSREALEWDYPNQRFTRSGYPMWSSLSIYRAHVLNLESGESEPLLPGEGISWGNSWSPDGRYLAFYSDRSGTAAVWIWDRETGRSRQVSEHVPRMFDAGERPLWSPDGKQLLFKAVPRGMTLKDLEKRSPWYGGGSGDTAEESPAESDAVSVKVYRSPPGAAESDEAEVSSALEDSGWLDYTQLGDLVLVDVESGASRRLIESGRPAYVALSPDGRFVATLSMGDLVPNSQTFIYSIELHATADGTSRTLAEVASGPNAYPTLSWSPDSTRVAYTTLEGEAYGESGCYVVNVETAEEVDLCAALDGRAEAIGLTPVWSPEGTALYLLDSAGSTGRYQQATGRLWKVRADGGSAREIGKIEGRTIHDIVRLPDGNTYWPAVGDTMVVRTLDESTKEVGFYALDPKTGVASVIAEFGAVIRSSWAASAGNPRHLAYVQEDAVGGQDVWQIDVETGERRQLTFHSPRLEPEALGQPRLIEWISLRGEKLRGALLLPAGYETGRRYPLIVWVYGGLNGSESLYRFGFGWGPVFNAQVLASRGYAALFPDVPLHPGTPVRDVVSAVMPGVNKAIELGIADPEKLAVMGQSFGGYNTLALVTQTTRFKAAIMMNSAPVDLFEGYSRFSDVGSGIWTGYYEQGQGGMGGTPWEFPQRYYDNSPFFLLDRVTTPVMMQRGSEDEISAANGAVFVALQRLDKQVEFLVYEGESHVLQKRANILDFWERRLAFLKRYLCPEVEGPCRR